MIPTKFAIYALLALAPLAILASYSVVALWLLGLVCVLVLAVSLFELLVMKQQARSLSVKRQMAKSWSLGVPTRVNLELNFRGISNAVSNTRRDQSRETSRVCRLQCHDMYPVEFTSEGLPQTIQLSLIHI